MRQLGEQPGRNNHRSGAGSTPGGGGDDLGWIRGRCWDDGRLQQILECCLIELAGGLGHYIKRFPGLALGK